MRIPLAAGTGSAGRERSSIRYSSSITVEDLTAVPVTPPVATHSASELLTKVEVAARLAVTVSAVERMIHNGRLPGAFRRGHKRYVPAETVKRVAAERAVLGIEPRQPSAPIQPWTGEQLAVHWELGAEGVPAREIAERTGHAVSSVT